MIKRIKRIFHGNEARPFEKRMMNVGRFPNILTALFLTVYIFYFSGIHSLGLGARGYTVFFSMAIIVLAVMQFLVAPNTNHLITSRISRRLELSDKEFQEEQDLRHQLRIYENKTDENFNPVKIKKRINEIIDERTELVKLLMKCPLKISLQVFTVFLVAIIIFIITISSVLPIPSGTITFLYVGCFLGSYNGGLFSFNYAEKLCSEYAVKLTSKGINAETIHEDKFYGMKMNYRILFVIIISFTLTTTVQFFYMWMGAKNNVIPKTQIFNMFLLTGFNSIFNCLLATFLYRQVTDSTTKLNAAIEKFFKESLQDDLLIPIDLSNEMSFNLHMVNDIINYLQNISSKANHAAIGIMQQISELASTAEQVAKNSSNLSGIVEKASETMTQNVKNQLELISTHIKEVSDTAGNTKKNVDKGFMLLTEDVKKLAEITQANIDTISGIKTLSDKIDNVWETIGKIDSLAEKTRIIAFNAELEATAAGERGENFHIVANEIRRLADTITDSTFEIKEKIKSIQYSSDNLVVTSEAGTQQIRDGSDFFSKLEEKFKELKLKSDITAEYATEIQNIISTQDTSFIQINATLTQINCGFNDFAHSTKTLTDAAETLREISGKLKSDYIRHMEEI